MKRILTTLIALCLCLCLAACTAAAPAAATADAPSQAAAAPTEDQQLKEQLSTLEKENADLSAKNSELESSNAELQKSNDELSAKVEEAAPWFELSDIEKQAEEKKLAEEKAKQEAAEKAKQEAAEKAAAEEAKKGYDTGITYSQLSRTPDKYEGKKVKFSGRVIQVIEGTTETQLRIATKKNYDNVILVYYSSSLLKSRVLEDDKITVYGVSEGLYSYESTGSGTITIPLISVDKIDQ